jgi:uncharacterized protein
MRAGADAIVQADLGEDRWMVRADVLLRVPHPSDMGDWSYEVVDTKLAQETQADARREAGAGIHAGELSL